MNFSNTSTWGFKHAIRGMRNPWESWDKSDSIFHYAVAKDTNGRMFYNDAIPAEIVDCCKLGEKDLELAQKLIKAGSEHRKFLRQIFIQTEIEANVYEWLKMENKFMDKSDLPDNFEDMRSIKRLVSMNYEVAYSTKHKYGKDYDNWLKTLPYSNELIFIGGRK